MAKTTAETIDQRLGEALAEYEMAREAGRVPDRAAFLARHPELADALGALLDACAPVEALVRPVRLALDGRPLLEPPRLPDYEILGELGRGGMGVVYRARQVSTGMEVALKTINPDWLDRLNAASRAEAIERMRAEARATACLKHPGIVSVIDLREHDGRPYFVLELIEGESLADQLHRAGRLDNREAARHLAAVAEAVHFAHQRGILHRDLKPANVLVGQAFQPDSSTKEVRLESLTYKVADFGLAKLLREAPEPQASVRQEQRLLGTLAYMSPEQTRDADQATVASDVYSLGATLYELLTGRPPFPGPTLGLLLEQIRQQPPTPPRQLNPDVSPRLEQICLKCLEKEPGKRYGSAADLAADLRTYLKDQDVGWQLAAMGNLFVLLGLVVPVINAVVYAMLQRPFVEPVVWLCAFSMYPALFAVFLLAPRSRWEVDAHSTRKELWAVWGGKLFTAITIAVVLRHALDVPAREAILLCYTVFAALSGMAIFIMVRDMAKPLVLLAAGNWLVALLMLLRLDWAPLIYGAYGGLGCVLFGMYERRLGRELR